MSKTGRINHRRAGRGRPKAERHISVRSMRRDPPDLQKLSRAVIALALREAERDADAQRATSTGSATAEPDAVTSATEKTHD